MLTLIRQGSRRLLTYRRLVDDEVNGEELLSYQTARLKIEAVNGTGTVDELNEFRRKYFKGFRGADGGDDNSKIPGCHSPANGTRLPPR